MMISGPTSCGKTTLVKQILSNDVIIPKPQRIVWLYKRWQPLYDVIKSNVRPHVEFIQGIPLGLENDDFFDTRLNNLLILDDLASVAGKDSRITDLFTEGSHHRNLSVISINQNMFSNKDPTQRRNCHYMVLFNNPVDKQQVHTLARQMYPGKSGYFMDAFNKATKTLRGYLLIDLKPTTVERDRLKSNVLDDVVIELPNQIKDINKREYHNNHHLVTDHQRSNIESVQDFSEEDMDRQLINKRDYHSQNHLSADRQRNNINYLPESSDDKDDMTSCDDCGIVFNDVHDLQRHVKTWCPESHEPQVKRLKIESVNENPSTMDKVDNTSWFKQFYLRARDDNQDVWEEKMHKYIENGMDKSSAQEKADKKIKVDDKEKFYDYYKQVLNHILKLEASKLHRDVLTTLHKLIVEERYSRDKAVIAVLSKYRHLFEPLIEQYHTPRELIDSDSNNEDDTDDDMES